MPSTRLPGCTLVMIAKDEGPYLTEWIAWHRRLGFAGIVIYDNKSSDGSAERLAQLAEAGVIQHRPWARGRTESPQVSAYMDSVTRVRTEWLMFIDADEFLVLHQHTGVNDFLAGFADPDIGAVGINWRVFGDSGHAAPDGRPATQRFTRAAETDFLNNGHIKTFHRVDNIRRCDSMHACHVRGRFVHPSGRPLVMSQWGVSETVEHEVAQINHYFTRTLAEYEHKQKRGRAGVADTSPDKYHYSRYMFDWHNRNEVEDLSAARHGAALIAAMAELETLTSVPA